MTRPKIMPLFYAIILLITGLAVGLISGLLGVGGCFIMVPIQYYILKAINIDPTIAIRIAFGTNLLVVLPTALSATWRHHKKTAVLWRQAIILGISGAVAGFGGAFTAAHLSGNVLTKIFGAAVLLGSLRMVTAKPIRVKGEAAKDTKLYIFWGVVLGFITGLIGIGGGVLIVPIMLIFLNFHLKEAIATSTAIMIFTSLGGAIGYAILGWHQAGLPPYSIGYINLWQWLLLASTSVPMAQIGAHLTHKIHPSYLKLTFIITMTYMGLKMIGLFAWLGWPI